MRITGINNCIKIMALTAILAGCGNTENPPPVQTTPNVKPIAVISPATEQSIFVGDTISFNGESSSDPDANTPLTYAWTFAGATTSIQESTAAVPGSVSFTEAGNVTVSLVVTDNSGLASDPVSIAVIVDAVGTNKAPNGFISHDQGTGSGDFGITTGATVVFTGSAQDPENDAVSFAWLFEGGTPASATGTGPISVSYATPGTFSTKLTVTDSNNNVDLSPAEVKVAVADVPVDNKAPNGFISHDQGTGSGDFSITTGATVVFTGTATDPENDVVSYTWLFEGGTPASATGSGPISVSYATPGTFSTKLTVTDSNNNVDLSPAVVKVAVADVPVDNKAPNGFISHDQGTGSGDFSITTGATVVFTGTATDPENDVVSYTWLFEGGTPASATGSGPISVSYATPGTFSAKLTVTDSNNNVDPSPAAVVVTVADAPVNNAPDGFISYNNGTPSSAANIRIPAGTSIELTGLATDPEGDPVTYAWDFAGATASTTTGSGPITASFTVVGTYLVTLTVSDNKGNTDATPAELTVNVDLPEFQYLPVLSDQDGDPNNNVATYNLNADANINVNVVTPNGSWTTPMMRYNGLQLSPVIVAKRGDQMTINVQNNLTGEETTVHWHGFKIPGDQDGGPDFPILAGDSKTYSFTLVQPAGPLWFHPHADGTTATQVYNGLAGAFVITDDISTQLETDKQIPAGAYDIPLLIQDRAFAADNGTGVRALLYQAGGGMMGSGMMTGMMGDHILVNTVEMPALKVETRQYSFKLYNGSNARTYDIALADNTTFKVVATDGGLLNIPVETDHIMLAAGERAEIVVNFGSGLYAVGDTVMLVSRPFTATGMGGMGGTLANGAAFNIMRFDIATQVTDDVTLYASLPANADINTRLIESANLTSRDFTMSMGPGMQFLINNKTYDATRVDETITNTIDGVTEIWNISNSSPMAHPFHAHAIQWQILDRQASSTAPVVPASGVDLGWVDTVLVQPNETVRIIGHFDPVVNVGMYMYHCHILEHEEAGMMGMFKIIPAP